MRLRIEHLANVMQREFFSCSHIDIPGQTKENETRGKLLLVVVVFVVVVVGKSKEQQGAARVSFPINFHTDSSSRR